MLKDESRAAEELDQNSLACEVHTHHDAQLQITLFVTNFRSTVRLGPAQVMSDNVTSNASIAEKSLPSNHLSCHCRQIQGQITIKYDKCDLAFGAVASREVDFNEGVISCM